MRYGPALGVAHQEKERRARKTPEHTPPAIIVHEKEAEMTSRDKDDCRRFQPVSIVNRWRRAGRAPGLMHSPLRASRLHAPRDCPGMCLSPDSSPLAPEIMAT